MVNGFVLAGGASRRMGVDKARIAFPEHRPMALFVADVLATVCDRVALVRRAPDAWPLPVIVDRGGDDPHPLWGVAAALEAAESDRVLTVPCDVPFLTSAALARLLSAGGPAVAFDGERVNPLIAVHARSDADRALAFATGGRSARAFVEGYARVELAAELLRDVDQWSDTGRKGPIRALLDGLPWLGEEDRARVAAGERERLWARGALDPDDPFRRAPPASR